MDLPDLAQLNEEGINIPLAQTQTQQQWVTQLMGTALRQAAQETRTQGILIPCRADPMVLTFQAASNGGTVSVEVTTAAPMRQSALFAPCTKLGWTMSLSALQDILAWQ